MNSNKNTCFYGGCHGHSAGWGEATQGQFYYGTCLPEQRRKIHPTEWKNHPPSHPHPHPWEFHPSLHDALSKLRCSGHVEPAAHDRSHSNVARQRSYSRNRLLVSEA